MQVDTYDYGTDFMLETQDAEAMTNVRVHVQLKGTACEQNADGSVSVSINTPNLSYLATPPGSIFVCYHTPTKRLLVRRVDDVVREYEHRSNDWRDQKTITLRFQEAFDRSFQEHLKEYVVACARGARDYRLLIVTQPPETIGSLLDEGVVDLPVPDDRQEASTMLVALYRNGHDRTISRSFEKFQAVLGSSDETFLTAYMAEINLGVNGRECDRSRIRAGIDAVGNAIEGGKLLPGSLLYSVGNAWFALEQYKKARDAYNSALFLLDGTYAFDVAARCCKNLGTALEKLNNPDAARSLYEYALDQDPNLAEAHFALALWHYRRGGDLDRALEHLDAIVWPTDSAGTSPSVLGWRAEILFKQRRIDEAFRDVRALLSDERDAAWVWPWCAKLVATHGRTSLEAAQLSVSFWSMYLGKFADDLSAKGEMLLCVYYVHDSGGRTEWDYERFKRTVDNLVTGGVPNPAFLWDRVGHWAQGENDWSEAEACYRRACALSPNEYGYCLGTALNFLHRYEEAVLILLPQATEHQPDAMSWFQLAVAREGIGDVAGCIEAYRRALALNDEYDLAWFNLGGVYWNSGDRETAVATWREAMRRFPTHQLSSKLQRDLSDLLD